MSDALSSANHEPETNYVMKLFSACAMILVVTGHIWSEGFKGPFNLFDPYQYQVAAFVFVSGYFYNTRREENPLSGILRDVRHLILPTLAIYAVYGLIWTFLRTRYGFQGGDVLSLRTLFVLTVTDGHQFALNMAMWFVVPLFLAKSINLVLRAIIPPPR